MMAFLEFVFAGPWHFFGMVLLIAMPLAFLHDILATIWRHHHSPHCREQRKEPTSGHDAP